MQLILMTSDNYHKCLNPYLYLFDKYAGLDNFNVTICGFTYDEIAKDACSRWDVPFYSIGEYADYPVNKWSDAFWNVLNNIAKETFIFALEDYWLFRPVDVNGMKMLFDYAGQFRNVLKIDLAFDRLYINGGSTFNYGESDYDNCGYLDLLKSPPHTPYNMSLWGGIWNREQMKRFIVPGEKAQEIELFGSGRVDQSNDVLVLGTRQAPMRHSNIYQSRHNGNPVYFDSGWRIKEVDLEHMRDVGWIG